MVKRRVAALLLWAWLLGQPAAAQIPLAPADPNEALVEELVVTAADPGPAWWTVSNGSATAYVLGVPSLAPKRMQWDRTVFDRRLAKARVVILPFENFRVKTLGALGAGVNYLRLRSSQPYEERMDAEGRRRFAAAREQIAQPAKRYRTHHPLAAGLMMSTDYREHFELTTTDPTKLIKLLAHQAGKPIVEKSYDLGPQLGAIIRTPDAAGRACLNEVIAQIEAGPEVTRQAARAWAAGDVRAALDNERTFERCIAFVPGAQALDARVKRDTAAAIEAALATPGSAIALVPLRPLLAQGGVLDQLRAKGLEVTTPGETIEPAS
ncbi:TraB/GumN family protein [Phenylobacterium immobile]|uniref:TraB/GumN family protein n=1 Tax=Phenylobacterium immobile TaxID=21 RepID=UPI000AA2CB74|nr:TraB/GumN family protein [Phenylobacterium immobile]